MQTGESTRAVKVAEEYVNFVAQHATPKAMTQAELKKKLNTERPDPVEGQCPPQRQYVAQQHKWHTTCYCTEEILTDQ